MGRLRRRKLARRVHRLLASAGLCFRFAAGEKAFSPWAMALPFGVGQLMAAGVLYWSLERWDGRQA